jgi:hypothetical protein
LADVQYHQQRTEWATEETKLTPETVANLELKWSVQLDNVPLALNSLTTPVVVRCGYQEWDQESRLCNGQFKSSVCSRHRDGSSRAAANVSKLRQAERRLVLLMSEPGQCDRSYRSAAESRDESYTLWVFSKSGFNP